MTKQRKTRAPNRSKEELDARPSVNITVSGSALVRLRDYRDALGTALGLPVTLTDALDFVVRHAPDPEMVRLSFGWGDR